MLFFLKRRFNKLWRRGNRGKTDPKVIGAQARLEELGYKLELQRTLSVSGNVTMAVVNASPVMAIFIFALAPLGILFGVIE